MGTNNNEADFLSRSMMIQCNEFKRKNSLEIIAKCIDEIKKYLDNSKSSINTQILFEKMKNLHLLLVHPGKNKMFNTLKNYLKFQGMKKLINDICKSCNLCQCEKSYKISPVSTKYVTVPYERKENISVDIKGPIRTLHYETKIEIKDFYISVATDLFSRYPEIDFIYNIHSSTVTRSLERMWLSKYSIPMKILTDNGRQFTFKNFSNLMKKIQYTTYIYSAL
ncbi:hypothetical protein DMUE_3573 [Dictyocoela muelleri]|nr:hypothetical protein DMUE_3573 [Dictyocoela muelleri]